MENPAAVDRPVLSWKTLSGKEGFVQTAYRVEVASSGENSPGRPMSGAAATFRRMPSSASGFRPAE